MDAVLADTLKARSATAARSAYNFALRLGRDALFVATKPPTAPRCIVVHRVGNVGDMVVAMPALKALRHAYPGSRLVLLTSRGPEGLAGGVDLLSGVSYLDEIIDYQPHETRGVKLKQLVDKVRSARPDLFVSLPSSIVTPAVLARNLIFARMAGAEFSIGNELSTIRLFAASQARYFGLAAHEVDRQLRLLRELGISNPASDFEFGPVKDADLPKLQEIAEISRPFVAICPGGKQEAHRWPAQSFALIGRWLRENYGATLVAVGSSSERALCATVLESAGGGVNAAGTMSLRVTAELLREAGVLVTNDTGPMHLAAAVATPVVAIFGSRDFAGRWYPYGPMHEVLRARTVCDECMFSEEISDHCVRTIAIADVRAACARAMARRRSVD